MKTRNVYVYLTDHEDGSTATFSDHRRDHVHVWHQDDMRAWRERASTITYVSPIVKVSVPLPEPKRAARAKGDAK